MFAALLENPSTQYRGLMASVEHLAKRHDLFPTAEQCDQQGFDASTHLSYYRHGILSPRDKMKFNEIVWDLIVERIVTMGLDAANENWPFLRLTDLGRAVASGGASSGYYDPDGYVALLGSLVHDLDEVIKQYAAEGVRAFRQGLLFASAVMVGAAAEKALLLLLEAIATSESDPRKKRVILSLLERPRLPTIFQTIQGTLDRLIKANSIPYPVHQGATEHLLSLFEMVRVQRNEAVHPEAGEVNRYKVFLTLQTMPAALERVYRLTEWFSANSI